jgi:hypothetical protein
LPLRGALDSRLHWRSPKLTHFVRSNNGELSANEDSEPRLHQTGGVSQKPKTGGCDFPVFDFQSRHPSLSTTGILRSSERCLSVASLARAQNTEERKNRAKRGEGFGWLFLWFVSFGHSKEMNTQPPPGIKENY